MFRKTAKIFAQGFTAVMFALCLFASFADLAQAQTATTPKCVAFNRNWVCGTPGNNPNVPVTQCIEVLQGGTVTSRGDRSFTSATALQIFLNSAPAGTVYQPCTAAPACTATTEDKTVACPTGQTGSIVQRRTVNVGGVCGSNSAFTEISNTCRAIPSCTETTETKQLPCPAGQTGQITQSRQVNVGGVCGTNAQFVETSNTCRIPPANTCTFNGVTLTEGQTVTAFQTQTTPFGTVCISETRRCTATGLTGSYQFSNCTPEQPKVCVFNGQTIANGASVTAYKTTTTAFGTTCEAETRRCENGVLSGNFQFSNCTPEQPKVCVFNGQTIANGASVTAYKTTTTAFGTTCESQTRTCNNGQLSGSYQFSNCTPEQPKTCTFNGHTIPNGGTVIAYKDAIVTGTSATAGDAHAETSGGVCISETRVCNNGVLSGTYTNSSCNQTCGTATETRRGVTACPAGQEGFVTEIRTINVNGQCGVNSDWTVSSSSCTALCPVGTTRGSNGQCTGNVCVFNGQVIQSGGSVTAYQSQSLSYGQQCLSETRTCNNGQLSGSYTSDTCSVNPPRFCKFNGQIIQNGQSITAYQSQSAPNGQQCVSETRTCNDGQLSGSYGYSNCSVQPPQNCTTPWGAMVANGQTVTAYRFTVVSYGQSCQNGNAEQRLCTNGVLSGSFTNQGCQVQQPTSCIGPDGRTIQSGSSVTYYAQNSMPENAACTGEVRTCNNGTLSGSYGSTTCTQTMCTYAQAGDAIARACSTTTYSGGRVTGVTGGNTMCSADSLPGTCGDVIINHGNTQTGGSTSNGSSNSSSSSSSSSSGGSSNVTINNSNTNQNSNANSVVVH